MRTYSVANTTLNKRPWTSLKGKGKNENNLLFSTPQHRWPSEKIVIPKGTYISIVVCLRSICRAGFPAASPGTWQNTSRWRSTTLSLASPMVSTTRSRARSRRQTRKAGGGDHTLASHQACLMRSAHQSKLCVLWFRYARIENG